MAKNYKKPLTFDEMSALPDSEIDFSDIPELGEDFWKNARVTPPRIKRNLVDSAASEINAFSICASDKESLFEEFGDRGFSLLNFASRKERHQANNGLEEEIYILRRYLFSLAKAGKIDFPIVLFNSETPDFHGNIAGNAYGIEVTEATLSADQREMTKTEKSSEPTFLGEYGGRYYGGISYDGNPRGRLPDRDLVADIIRSIRRKRAKPYIVTNITLLLYLNGNAAMMAELESTYRLLQTRFCRWQNHLLDGSLILKIAILWDSQKKIIELSRVGGGRVLDLHASMD